MCICAGDVAGGLTEQQTHALHTRIHMCKQIVHRDTRKQTNKRTGFPQGGILINSCKHIFLYKHLNKIKLFTNSAYNINCKNKYIYIFFQTFNIVNAVFVLHY